MFVEHQVIYRGFGTRWDRYKWSHEYSRSIGVDVRKTVFVVGGAVATAVTAATPKTISQCFADG